MHDPREDVLVMTFGGLARLVHALPALRLIRARHRGARITILTTPDLLEFARDTPYVSDAEAFDPAGDSKTAVRLGQTIEREGVAVVYDLDGGAFGARVKGAVKRPKAVWCRPAEDRSGAHPIDAMLEQVETGPTKGRLSAGATRTAIPDIAWARTARPNAPSMEPAFFSLYNPFVILAPAHLSARHAKSWPSARWAGLAVRLASQGVGVALYSAVEDRAAARAVVQACPQARDLSSRADLLQMAALSARADAALGQIETGATHLIAAGGCPTIAIASSHDAAARRGPRGRQVVTLASEDHDDLSVDYVAALFRMYAQVGAPSGRAAQA